MITPSHAQWALLRALVSLLAVAGEEDNTHVQALLSAQGVQLDPEDWSMITLVADHLAHEFEARASGLLHSRQVFDELLARSN